MSVIRSACFTINNYTFDDFIRLCNIEFKYLIIGAEIGESGTKHLQGYIELNKQTRFNTAKKLIGDRAHIEQRRGTAKQASEYCKKDDDYFELGVMSSQGARNDLDNIRVMALEVGLRGVTAVGNLQQIKVAEKFLTYNEPARDFKPKVTWLYGPTGTGKSRRAREIVGDDYYCKNDGSKWWPGYDAHESVIIDDFRPSWWSITEMLSLLDRYEKVVEFKGGYRQFLARNIVVTSALHPRDYYQNTGECIEQLLRRIDSILCVTEVSVTEVER